jgi:ACS family hexuronate transporter-like MFS transporter
MDSWALWAPTVSMTLVSLISYVDRNTLALLAPAILKENNLTAEQYGFIITAFSLAYMAANPLWGRWLDRWGVRWGMLAAVLFWTAASASHALVSGFAGFACARAALGFGEGATFPGGLRTVVMTLPAHLRSRGTALAYSGGSLGAVLTPLIVTPVFLVAGWRGAFLFTGLIGLLWLAWWLLLSRRSGLNAAPAPSAPAAPHAPAIHWREPRLWAFMASYALGSLPLAFVLYHSSLYFSRIWGKSQAQIGAVLWIPPLGWELGYFLWGWAADRLARGRGAMRGFRILIFAALILTLPLAFVPRADSFGMVLALLFWAMFVAGGNVIVSVSYATHVFTPANAGLIAGLGAGSWSALVALAMPFFGRLIDGGRFAEAFLLATAVPAAGFLFWLWINRPGGTEQ